MIRRLLDRLRGPERPVSDPLPGWLTGALVLGTAGVLLVLEWRRPLRRQQLDKRRRDARNVAMAACSAAAISLLEAPLVNRASRAADARRIGLVKRLGLPPWAEVALGVVLMDYTLYVWHVLTHKVPALWRLHEVHHADLDLDASTAVRFHFAEMIASVPWRVAQVLLIGAGPRTLSTWQTLTTMAILFHHSNTRLPIEVERWLSRIIVTPRMHGIHHSVVREETDSNWGTIFSWPDALHRTLRKDVPQREVEIGVPDWRDPQALTLGRLLRMPFDRGHRAQLQQPPQYSH